MSVRVIWLAASDTDKYKFAAWRLLPVSIA